MEDQNLGRLLRELPREKARPGFTTRVLARLDAVSERRERRGLPRAWRPRLAAAFTVLVVASGAAGLVRYEQREAQRAARVARARQLLRELRAEHGQIKRELESLPAPPVVYLGGNEDMDLVVDLRQVREESGVRPATYRGDTSHSETF
jgi:hypothetical protein